MRCLLAAASVLALSMTSLQAAQIIFGPSSQNVTFAGDGAGDVLVSSGALNGPALDTTNGATVGAFSISEMNFVAGPEVGGFFIPGGQLSEVFTYNNPDGDLLIESIKISMIQDNTTHPKFFFTGTTIARLGDTGFLAGFGPVGTQDTGDFVMNDLGITLDALAFTTGLTSATISSGEKPTPTSTDEPAALAILAGALLGIGLLRRWDMNA